MGYHYTAKAEPEKSARAVGRDLPISTKQSIEICAQIRGKRLSYAKQYLQEVIELKRAVPFRRFNRDVGHKKVGGPGRYPVKACTHILKLLNSVEANSQNKGLAVEELIIETIVPHRGAGNWHYGRHRRRKMKNTTIEVIVKHSPEKKSSKAGKEKQAEEKPARDVKEKKSKPEETTGKSAKEKETEEQIKPEKKDDAKSEAKKEVMKDSKGKNEKSETSENDKVKDLPKKEEGNDQK